MYREQLLSLNSLFEQNLTREISVKALRSRAQEGVLVFMGLADDGRTRLYDKNLSLVRVLAARQCKNEHPRISWSMLKHVFAYLDSNGYPLNQKIIRMLNDNHSMLSCVSEVKNELLENIKSFSLV